MMLFPTKTMMTVRLGTLFLIFKVLSWGLAEESPCTPGFESKLLVFKVHEDHLHRGERLGRVIFNTCDGRTRIHFQSTDQGIDLNMDGTLMLRRSMTLHGGLKEFSVSAWDSSGKKHTASVTIELVRFHKDHDVNTLMNTSSVQMESPSHDLVLTFPKSSTGIKRAKRGWIIPPINVVENSKGPFPMNLVQIKSDYALQSHMAYRITGEGADQDPKGIFHIERLSGWISVNQPLDREKKAFYTLVVHANGVDDIITEQPMNIIVYVADQNDNSPLFTQKIFYGNVSEALEKGEVFMIFKATDADDEDNTENADVKYSIISQDPPFPKPNMFDIDPESGRMSVLETGLDRKQWSRYTLVIKAADMNGEGLSTTVTAVITVTDRNDKTSQFERGWIIPPINVPENSRGPFPMTLVQIKSDSASEAQIVYRITGEGADEDPKGIFQIECLSGWISVTRPLDREKKASYKLVAHASGLDAFKIQKPMEIIVNVIDQNDNRPVFTQDLFNGNVPEAAGEVFMTVTATDADDKENTENANIRYSIIRQDPPSPKPNMFAINPVSGGISVLETGLDRKQWSRYTLVIKAADMIGEGLSATVTAVITVTDRNDKTPQFERGWIIPPINVPENSRGPFPKRLVQIKSDFASEAQIAYRITGEGADEDPKGIFQIERLSGWISVTRPLDRERKAFYKLVAHANGVDVNIGQKPMDIVIRVTDQNDNKPVFTQTLFNRNVPESAGKGEVFMTITATDADDKETTDNANIRYSIISQDPPSPKLNMFAINPITGEISVLETGLDREQWSRYTLVIKAADMIGEGLSASVTAVITVTDSNDKTPLFGRDWIFPPINVPENNRGPFPKRLVQIKSNDAPEAKMDYSITGEGADQDPKGIFQIERLSGWISVTRPLDREIKASYKLLAHASGLDAFIIQKPMEIIVNVIDQNDNRPVFTQDLFIGNVPEAAGEVFMTVTATDADDKENTNNADIRYSIISQDPPTPKPNMFDINPVSGGISVLETGLDRKQWSRYTLVIKAADMNGEGLSTTGTAVITITDTAV